MSTTINTFPQTRTTDPQTSHDAAASIANTSLSATRAAILQTLRTYGPLTDTRIYKALSSNGHNVSPSGARSRRAELVSAGLVKSSETKERLVTGRFSTVWQIA